MIRVLRAIICAGMLLVPALNSPAIAHSQRTAITTVLFNPRTSNLEIMHRFHLHDAEHAVQEVFGKGADILGSDETRAKFASYVADRFFVRNGETNDEVELKFVGHDIDGKFIWVYQEAEIIKTTSLIIAHNALRDLWPDQLNTVNVEGEFGVKSALFDGATEIAKIELHPHAH